jgi:hypothetical protein
MNNWQEWRCLTDPTNALSVLKLLAPTGGVSGVTVSWQSVTSRSYWLEGATNFASAPAFSSVASNLAGQVGHDELHGHYRHERRPVLLPRGSAAVAVVCRARLI